MIEIVPVAEHHAEGFRACLDVVALERRYRAQIEAPPVERIEAFVRESVANDAAQFMAVDVDRVVGWVDVLPRWADAFAHAGSLGMGVLPPYQGRGIGRRLLGACIAKAWAQGITRIGLEVRVDNERAIGLYRAFGFEQEAVKRRAMRFDGVDHDALLLSLLKDAG